MLFNSFAFVFLVVATMALYYLPPLHRLQRFTLIGASFIFYAAHEPVLLLLLVASATINIVTSHFVIQGRPAFRSTWAAVGVFLNLGLLAFFKYSPLFARTFFDAGASVGSFLVTVPLPIGISFFTFQGITLLVDTLRVGERRADYVLHQGSFRRHALNTTLYIAFFPQLVAGPIVKAHEFVPQIGPKSFRDIDWDYCFRALVAGYFLKMVVADNLKDQTFWIAYPHFQAFWSLDLVALLVSYSAQIFSDFAGYSLIAIGTAGLFGYRLPQNFNFPYIAASFSEFWRRWHISLSSFLKEYLYIPIGGNRRGNVRTYVNLMVVMLLGGLWHGAAWGYMVWGGVHGAALAVERFFSTRVTVPDLPWVRGLRITGVFGFVTFAWLLFKLPDLSQALEYLKAIPANILQLGYMHPNRIGAIVIYCVPVVLYHLHYLAGERLPQSPLSSPLARLAPVTYGTMLFLVLTNSGSPEAFVYFQF